MSCRSLLRNVQEGNRVYNQCQMDEEDKDRLRSIFMRVSLMVEGLLFYSDSFGL
jgi:hypothetical protein